MVRRKQILALSGGGFRGLYTAQFLAHCEAGFNASCSQRFDFIAGTSIGALLAAGLAMGKSAGDLAAAVRQHGPTIFRRRALHWSRRIFFAAPYAQQPLRAAITAVLGEPDAARKLNTIDKPLLIASVNYSTGTDQLFLSKGVTGNRLTASDVPLVDAVLASAAAPTFFPLVRIGNNDFADGGLIVNAPDLAALTQGLTRLKYPLEEIYMLSVGTAARRGGAAIGPKPKDHSVLAWFFVRGLVQMAMGASETMALAQAEAILGARHLRIDREPAPEQVKDIRSMDIADAAAIATLDALAEDSWRAHAGELRLQNFFER